MKSQKDLFLSDEEFDKRCSSLRDSINWIVEIMEQDENFPYTEKVRVKMNVLANLSAMVVAEAYKMFEESIKKDGNDINFMRKRFEDMFDFNLKRVIRINKLDINLPMSET